MESAEHAWIGNQITLQFPSGAKPAANLPLKAGKNRLTYGQCIALGGDFYGVVGAPISTAQDPVAAFRNAWGSLATSTETAAILAIMDEELAAVTKAQKAGREPSTAYAGLGDTLSKRWNRVTGGGSVGSDLLPMGRYLLLSAENWDHFTEYAVKAYRAGHAVAMHNAGVARTAGGTPEEREGLLQEAYAINAFADHFMTDLFSAGHLRAPRKEMFEQVMTPVPGFSGTLGSLLVRCMHDEDSKNGLNVRNAEGNAWVAYGDKRLLDKVSEANRRVVVNAVQASADDVWQAHNVNPGNYSALKLIPDLSRVGNVSTRENSSPLFLLQDGVPARRNDVSNRKDYSWTKDWWGWTTYALLMMTHSYQNVKCYNLSTGTFVGYLGSASNYVSLVSNVKDAHGMTWDFDGDDLYLRKDTSGGDRYLGLSEYGKAGWGLKGGWRNPVLYNEDMSISLKEDPKRKLYIDGDRLRWTDGGENQPVLRIEMPLEAPSMTA